MGRFAAPRQRAVAYTLVGMALAGLCLPAWGQMEEVVVTARKKEESLQDVPMSISAFTAQDIERKGITNIADVAKFTPSVQFDESFTQSDTRITIRGLAPTRGRQNVAVLVDGIDVSSEAVTSSGGSLLINTRLLDLERIEVLKAPQTALYGRAAFAGAIQYITKKPSDALEWDVSVDGNDKEQYSLNAGISFPIFDEKLGVRLNASAWDEGGYYNNQLTTDTLADDEGYGFSFSTRSAFDSGLILNFRAEYTHDEGKPSAQTFLNFNTVATVPDEAAPTYTNAQGQVVPGADITQCYPSFIQAISSQATTPSDRTIVERARRIVAPELASSLGFPDPATATDADYAAVIAANPFLYPYCEDQVFSTTGKIPDGDELTQPFIGTDPRKPGQDYEGFDRDYWRVALNAEWALEKGSFNMWLGYLRDQNDETQDTNSFGVPSTNEFRDGNVNTFSFNNEKKTEQFNFELRYATDFEGPLNLSVGGQYWHEDVDNDSKSITGQGSGSHCFWNSAAGIPLPGIDDSCPGYTETSILPYQQAASDFRSGVASPANRETDHYSFYGVVDFEFAPTWTLSLEGRFSWEEIDVAGPLPYDPGASGGPGGLNPCGIFFRACEPFDQWLADGNFFADSFDAQDPEDGPGLIANIPEICIEQDPARVQRSIDFGPSDDVNGDGFADGIDTFNPWCVAGLNDQESWWSPKVAIDWAATDNINLFASWSKARKPGGFSTLTIGSSFLDREIAEFDPEKMDAWELGAKSDLFDRTLRVNGALFFQDFTDKQVLTSALGNDGRLVSKIENASAAQVWGAEIDVVWAPVAPFIGGNWTLSAGYQMLDSKYKDFRVRTGSSVRTAAAGNCIPVASEPGGQPDLCEIDFSDNDLENAPDGSFSGQVRFQRGLFGEVELFVETDLQWVDKRYTDETNISFTDDVWNTDFRIGVQGDNWDALLYINNVFDDDTTQSTGGGPGLGCCFVLGSGIDILEQTPPPADIVMVDLPLYRSAFLRPPRVIGVRGSYRFGSN